MKILHLASEYPPQKVYGLGRFVHDLAVEQANQNHEVHVITNSMGGKDYDIVDKGVFVHRVDFPPPPKPADSSTTVVQFNIQVIERAVPIVKKIQPQVVNTHDWLTFLAGRVVNRCFSIPHIFTVHDTMIGKNFGKLDNPKKLGANIEKYGCEDADLVICCSDYMKKELISIYGSKEKTLRVIPCGVEESSFSIDSDTFLLENFRSVLASSDEKIVTYVGRLDQEKGLDLLLNAIPLILRSCDNVKFIIAGKGVMEESIQEWIQKNNFQKKVQLIGYIQGEVLSHFYKMSDLHIMPSSYEPFGIVALEAMINKAPVVVSDSGGLSEIVDDFENGMKFKKGDFDHLANTVITALQRQEETKKIAERGYQKAKNIYNWSIISKETTNVYRECLQPSNDSSVNQVKPTNQKLKICLVVQTYEKDFHLLHENALAFEKLVEDGHKVVFLCYKGDKKLLLHWQDKVDIIEADEYVPKEYKDLIFKCISGYYQCLFSSWDWLVKIDADTLICGSISDFVKKYNNFDAIGCPSQFKPVLKAISIIGPPNIPSDILQKIGNKYMRGFFYCIKRGYVEKMLPIATQIAPRDKMEDATFTAVLASLGAKIHFCEEINYYNSFEKTQINLRSPVIHVESKEANERQFFAKHANALFMASVENSSLDTTLKLSLIIHTRNRKDFILRMLQTIQNAWVENEIELIIIDYGGTDSLAQDVQKIRWPNLRYIYVDCPGTFSTAHARNIAFKAAKGEWIGALDCDLLLPDNFIHNVLTEFNKNRDIALYAPVYKIMPQEQQKLENGALHPVDDFLFLKQRSLENRIEPPAGSIIIAPLKYIFQVGGYDENYTGYGFQDIDLIERLKKTGLPQVFSEEIYALHQFHGYPDNYNTSQIEAKNRNYFLSNQNKIKRNYKWGELPITQQHNLSFINWLETLPTHKKKKEEPIVTEHQDIIVWCQWLSNEKIENLIRVTKTLPYKYRITVRLICDSNIQTSESYGFRVERHSLAQIITQVPRTKMTIIPLQSNYAEDLKSSCETLNANYLSIDLENEYKTIQQVIHSKINTPDYTLKILVGMDEGIGNMIMLTPMLKALKELFPNSEIYVLGCNPALQVLQGWDVIKGAISQKDELENFYDLLLMSGWRRKLPDILTGINFRYPPLIAGDIHLQKHESEQHLELVRQLGYLNPTPSTHCSYKEFSLEGKIRIGLADTSNSIPEWQKKRWPYYRKLAEFLLGKGYTVFVFGGKNDKELYEEKPWPQGVVNFQDKLNILETAGALKNLDVLIANDSGLAHMAAALGVATLCLWGPSSYIKNEPLGEKVELLRSDLPCSPCQGTPNWIKCQNYECLSGMQVEVVQQKIEEVLKTCYK